MAKKFSSQEVDDKLIGVILYSAQHAFSAGELQPWKFIVVKDENLKKQLSKASLDDRNVAEAPIDIVLCVDLDVVSLKYGKRGEILYSTEDAAAATMLAILAAQGLGLSTDLIRNFDEEDLKYILNLPDNLRPYFIIPLGYAEEYAKSRGKIPLENITSLNRYGEKFLIAELQPETREKEFTPIGNLIENAIKKRRRRPEKLKKSISLKELLRKLSK